MSLKSNAINNNAPLIGAVQYYSIGGTDTSYVNQNWLKCDGSTYSQVTYPTLFSRLGLLNPGGTVWVQRTSPTTSTFNISTYGGNYVLGGNGGAIVSSTDGITWTARTSGTGSIISSLVYGNGLYVYGGAGGVLATSTDAITWTSQTSGTTTTISVLGYGNGKYISFAIPVINVDALFYSTDAVTWNRSGGYANSAITNSIAYGNGIYIASGNLINTSTDGISWQTRQPTNNQSNSNFLGYNGTNFYFCGGGGGNNIVGTSTDGVYWTGQYVGTTNSITSITYGNSTYVVGGSVASFIATSTDAITWTTRTAANGGTTALGFGNGLFLGGGSGGVLQTSTNGITWTARTSGSGSTIQTLIYGNGIYVFAGYSGSLATSTDAITWTARTSGTSSNIQSVIYAGGIYVYGGTGGALSTSTDAITWTARTSGTAQTILALTYGSGIYVYGGTTGVLASSTDAITWTSRAFSGTYINGLVYDGSLFHATGINLSYTSTDGVTWNNTNTSTVQSSSFVVYDTSNSLFILGSGTNLYTTTDGISFTTYTSNLPASITKLTYGNGIYVGLAGSIYTSTNLIDWNVQSTPSTSISTLNQGGSIFFTGGATGIIMTSNTNYNYNIATQFQVPTDNKLAITTELTTNYKRSLYIKAT